MRAIDGERRGGREGERIYRARWIEGLRVEGDCEEGASCAGRGRVDMV